MIKHYSISCPENLMVEFDELVEKGLYGTRSAAIQEAMRELINKNHEKTLLKLKVNTSLRPATTLAHKEPPT